MKTLPAILLIFLSLNLQYCAKDKIQPTDDKEPQIDYSFFIAGHTYGKPGVDNLGLHPPFEAQFDSINAEEHIAFGVLTGDIVINSTPLDWDHVDAAVDQLNMPIYFAPGNHDIGDNDVFETRYGDTYFSFKHQGDLFIILDPNIDGWNISGDQLDFLKSTLEDNQEEENTIHIFTHQLLWWTEDNIYKNVRPNSITSRADEINFWSEIEPLLNDLANEVFLYAGDVGAHADGCEFMYHHYDNLTFIASGMGGGERDNYIVIDVFDDKSVAFRLLAINGNDPHVFGALTEYQLK